VGAQLSLWATGKPECMVRRRFASEK